MSNLQYPSKLTLARLETPLQPLTRVTNALRDECDSDQVPNIWIKRDDLTGCAESGNKIRKLEYTLARALDNNCDTVITCGGIQSNHCRATALLCARLGVRCILVLRGNQPEQYQANTLLDKMVGANVVFVPLAEYVADLDQILESQAKNVAEAGGKAWIIPTGASDGHGVWGYVECARELKSDFSSLNIEPGAIVLATGSGGTQAGLTAGSKIHDLNIPIYGVNVCDDAAWFVRKVTQDLNDWHAEYADACNIDLDISALDIQVIDGYVGPGYAKATDDIFSGIQLLASQEGVILDPVYTGKAWYAMLDQIRCGRFRHVDDLVFVHTGGIYGNFAFSENYNHLF
ncbi:L-cysteate sulfo-lyase [BD1-7 clade bacterium]|uniref:L-cysteate sulfo-lyase n=1 Tax=BD1-7 clade bacterium TaxID=2029982 RepID=A0A5S9QLJ6_9GAMM|nr:L-cysteate sulfo-lyase [BD1-7 clade bacterium]